MYKFIIYIIWTTYLYSNIPEFLSQPHTGEDSGRFRALAGGQGGRGHGRADAFLSQCFRFLPTDAQSWDGRVSGLLYF